MFPRDREREERRRYRYTYCLLKEDDKTRVKLLSEHRISTFLSSSDKTRSKQGEYNGHAIIA